MPTGSIQSASSSTSRHYTTSSVCRCGHLYSTCGRTWRAITKRAAPLAATATIIERWGRRERMKLVSFETREGQRHIGALLPGEVEIADLTASDAAPYFRDMLALIDSGEAGLA